MMKKLTFLLVMSGIILSACNGGSGTPTSSTAQSVETSGVAAKSLLTAGKNNTTPAKNNIVNNSGWSLFGNPAGTNIPNSQQAFTIANDGSKYFAIAKADSNGVAVMKYTGTAWVYLPDASTKQINGKTVRETQDISITSGSDGSIYLAYVAYVKNPDYNKKKVFNKTVSFSQLDDSHGWTVPFRFEEVGTYVMKKFVNGQWQTLSTEGLPPYADSNMPSGMLRITSAADNSLYFSISLSDERYGVMVEGTPAVPTTTNVLKFNGGKWESVGGDQLPTTVFDADKNIVQFDNRGTPYLLHSYSGDRSGVELLKFDGQRWVTLSNTKIIAGYTADFKIDNNNNIYFAYAVPGVKITDPQMLVVKKFDGTKWVDLAAPKVGVRASVSIDVDSIGNLYLIFGNHSQNGLPYVLKYDGQSWGYVGGQVAQYTANSPILKVDPITSQIYTLTEIVSADNFSLGAEAHVLSNNAMVEPASGSSSSGSSSSGSSSSGSSSSGSSSSGSSSSGSSSSGSSSSGASKYNSNGNANYIAGSKVVGSDGKTYECKPYPYSGWCNGAATYYAPGSGMAWQDAWTLAK